jgi:hypothetical protein
MSDAVFLANTHPVFAVIVGFTWKNTIPIDVTYRTHRQIAGGSEFINHTTSSVVHPFIIAPTVDTTVVFASRVILHAIRIRITLDSLPGEPTFSVNQPIRHALLLFTASGEKGDEEQSHETIAE